MAKQKKAAAKKSTAKKPAPPKPKTPGKKVAKKAAAKRSAGGKTTAKKPPVLPSDSNPRAPQVELMGKVYDRVPYAPENPDYLCIDCEAAEGDIHELGCDDEQCPRCGGQLIGCGCLPSPDDE